MNTPSAKLLVLVGEQFACIKINGRANFSSSIDFKTLVHELRQKGYHYFVLDLSECMLMDSTFLGVLAGFGLKMGSPQGDSHNSGIELLNPNARITELLENLGVLHLFRMTQGPLRVPDQAQAHTHSPSNPTKEEVTRACLEAHQTLMEINPNNVSKFKEVTAFLAEDLKRLRSVPE
ncbi:MAG TPA: STAS domain-containing protein [Candidatus Sulfotelmatobacter sp.]|nr:STAS domain-containing protein [Candidatus Sulfotelmatobacter sp.]HWI59551.1 STAS domain-containing protein [Bacillota bacterium]